ncbi:MAG: hypothetical protein AAFS07_19260, partial [Pseudomonadota bacterium]
MGGNLKLLKWCLDQGCTWGSWTIIGAAMYNRMEVLQWCHDRECPWGEEQEDIHVFGQFRPSVLSWLRVPACSRVHASMKA